VNVAALWPLANHNAERQIDARCVNATAEP